MHLVKYFFRIPGVWPSLVLVVLSGLAEGIGLILFVPLLEIMTSGSEKGLRRPFDLIVDAFRALGLPVTLLSMLGAIAILILGSLALGYAQRRTVIRVRALYSRQQREALCDSLFQSTWGHISGLSHGETINQLLIECDRAASSIQLLLLCAASIIQIAIYFILSSMLSWELMVVTALFGVLIVIVVRPLQRRARELGRDITAANRDLGFYGVDFLKGAKLIKVTAAEETVLGRMKKYIGELFEVVYLSELNGLRIYFLVQAIPVLLLTAVIAISHEVLDINPSSTLVFLLVLSRIAPRMAQLQQQYQGFIVKSPGIKVVDQAIDACRKAREGTHEQQRPFIRLEDGIGLRNVSFAFPGGNVPALVDVTIDIRRNQMVALVGSSGAGKSTLIDLICGIRRPDSGRILIDAIDLVEIEPGSWHRKIGYVTQDVMVFNDTLRANLLFAHPKSTDAEIHRVLEQVHLADTVAGLADGLDTILGEGGIRLSGGQKQRIALARALLGNPQLLLLDEATSALDNESEFRIQKAIDSIAHTITIVIVAHRLSTVRKADVIYVMENGRIVESGTYDDLLARDGRFAQLHDAQFS